MASLFWHSSMRGTEQLGELKLVISGLLRDHGFQNVEISELDVKGSKNGTFTAIAHFKVANQRFWEVAMTSGGDFANTRAVNNEVSRMLHDQIHPL